MLDVHHAVDTAQRQVAALTRRPSLETLHRANAALAEALGAALALVGAPPAGPHTVAQIRAEYGL